MMTLTGSPETSSRIRHEVIEWTKCIAIAAVLSILIMTFVGRSTVVEGSSMEPTLHDRDRLWLDKISYRFHPPERGDIVVFDTVNGKYIKRVIATEGEHVWSKNGIVYVDGRPLQEDYILEKIRKDFPERVVPPGTVWVMGDNRNNSDDSRGTTVGFLPVNRIIGKAVLRYFPLTRVGRIGDEYRGG